MTGYGNNRNGNVFLWLLFAITLCIVLLAMTGCKCPCSVIPSRDTHNRDSVRTEYIHDSIYTDRWHTQYMKGDTLVIRDSVWRDRWRYKHDSIFIANTDTIRTTVTVEAPINGFWKGSGIALWVLIGAIVLGAIIGIIIKFAK